MKNSQIVWRLSKKMKPNSISGFTLVELIVVVGVIAILISITLVAVNPGRQFANARDSQRRSDLYSITNALYQYATENNGNLPEDFPETETCIGTGTTCYDLTPILIPTYITNIPLDPSNGNSTNTGYNIFLNASGRLQATATSELTGGSITIQR